jgi:hypothetical protein
MITQKVWMYATPTYRECPKFQQLQNPIYIVHIGAVDEQIHVATGGRPKVEWGAQ